jgi:hypothetical protein
MRAYVPHIITSNETYLFVCSVRTVRLKILSRIKPQKLSCHMLSGNQLQISTVHDEKCEHAKGNFVQ